ncbi:MAG TPA: hypothetical protein DCS93_25960 [Microscillaceae bacterium]|nr:hypothetical protein [Microscillaceae bacterium]
MQLENQRNQLIGYGICHLAIIPMRAQPTSKSEQVSQLMFGETFQVIKESQDQKFVFVVTDFDQYEGWIEKSRWWRATVTCYNQALADAQYMVIEDHTLLKGTTYKQTIFLGSVLPLYNQGKLVWDGQSMVFSHKVHQVSKPLGQKFILEIGFRFLGTPYLWGGKTIVGIDCSGLTQQVFKLAGYKLPRDAYEQAEIGANQLGVAETTSGDLAFFARGGRIIHVGIVVSFDHIESLDRELANTLQGKLEGLMAKDIDTKPNLTQPYSWIIHAYDCVRVDVLDNTGIYNLDEHQYTHSNHSFKRIINKNKLDLIK